MSAAAKLLVVPGRAARPWPRRAQRPRGDGRNPGSRLDPGQLERCVRLEGEAYTWADAIEAEEAAMDARNAEIARLGREVEGWAALVDRGIRASVDDRNRHRSLLGDFNARVQGHNAPVHAFNADCAGKPFHEADMRAVRARLGLNWRRVRHPPSPVAGHGGA